MKKKTVIGLALLILLTTIISKPKISILNFNIKEIIIENNYLLKETAITSSLENIYNKNLIMLKDSEIEKILLQNSFIDSFSIKKKFPNIIKIKIFEKKPIAVLVHKKKKFYLSEKNELIEYKKLKNFSDLPYIFGNQKDFKILNNNLQKINFNYKLIKKFIFYESGRWDLETKDEKIIKLPSKNYSKSLKNYLNLRNNKNFNKFKVFDYRIADQLILK